MGASSKGRLLQEKMSNGVHLMMLEVEHRD